MCRRGCVQGRIYNVAAASSVNKFFKTYMYVTGMSSVLYFQMLNVNLKLAQLQMSPTDLSTGVPLQ
jgi:hypothetical protein